MARWLWCCVALMASPSALADVDYYTYGSFENVRDAFIFLANIMSDPWYIGIGSAIGSLGILVATMINLGKGMMGNGSGNVLPLLMICFLGTSLFMVFLAPKTTVHVYDTTTNRYESVGNVPASLAEIAHLSNLFERYATSITASASLYGRDKHANANSLELMLNLLSADPLKHNVSLAQSMERYLTTCVTPAVTHPARYGNFDYASMLSGTTDFWGELEKTKNPNQYFNWLGSDLNCEQGYDEVFKVLVTNFDQTFKPVLQEICGEAGYDENDAAALNQCGTRVSEAGTIVFANSISYAPNQLLALSAISQSLYHVLTENVGTAVRDFGNMQSMSQGIGALLVSEGWLPSFRLATLVVILASSCVIIWFFFTPFLFRSLHLLLTLFIFMALWGVFDSVMHVVKMTSIENSFADIHAYEGGIKSFLMAPGELQKVIASYGKMQGMGVMLAALLTAILFKISAMPFAHIAERMADDIENTGKNVGNETLDVSNRQKKMRDLAETSAHYEVMSMMGVDRYADGAHSSTFPYRQQEAELAAISGYTGRSREEAITDQTSMAAYSRAGELKANDDYSSLHKSDPGTNAARSSAIQTMRTQSESRAYESATQAIAMPTMAGRMDNMAMKKMSSDRQTAATSDEALDAIAASQNASEIGAAEAKMGLLENKDGILEYSKEQATLQIQDGQAQFDARNEAVESGLAGSAQEVADTTAQAHLGQVLGSAAENRKLDENNLKGSYISSGQSTQAGNRSNIGGNRAINKLSDAVDLSPTQFEEMRQSQQAENDVAAALRRIKTSEALNQTELETAFQELSKQPIGLSADQYNDLVSEYYKGSTPAPIMADDFGWVTFSWDPANGMHNISIETGNSAINRSSQNVFENAATRLETADASVVLNTVNALNSEASILDFSREAVRGFGVYREMSEGESSNINTGVGGDTRLSAQLGVDGGKIFKAADSVAKLIPGSIGGKSGVPDFRRGPMGEKIQIPNRADTIAGDILSNTGDAISEMANIKAGGGVGLDASAKIHDTSNETASIDPAVGAMAYAIAEAKMKLANGENLGLQDKLEIAQDLQSTYQEMQSMSIEQLLSLSKEHEADLLEDHSEYPGWFTNLKNKLSGEENDELKSLIESDPLSANRSDVSLR